MGQRSLVDEPAGAAASTGRKLAVVASAIAACLFNAGLAFGFSAILPVLIDIGAFHDLCADAGQPQTRSMPCTAQDQALLGMFTWATCLLNLFSLPAGTLLDWAGPRATAAVGATVTGVGCLIFAIGGDGVVGHWYFYGGFLLLAISGPMLFTCTLSFSNLFPARKGLICAALVGCFDASSAVFVVLAAVISRGVPFEAAFTGYALLPLATSLVVLGCWPSTPVPSPVVEPISGVDQSTRWRPPMPPRLHHMGLRQQLLSPMFALLASTACVMMVSINFFIATVFSQMAEVDPRSALHLTGAFAIMLPIGGIVYTPFIGLLVDSLGATLGFIILCLLYITFQCLLRVYMSTQFVGAAFLAFVVFAMVRPLFYTLAAAFTGHTFGFATFGKLYGTIMTLAGIANLSLRPLGDLAGSRGFKFTNTALLGAQVVVAALPAYVLLCSPRLELGASLGAGLLKGDVEEHETPMAYRIRSLSCGSVDACSDSAAPASERRRKIHQDVVVL